MSEKADIDVRAKLQVHRQVKRKGMNEHKRNVKAMSLNCETKDAGPFARELQSVRAEQREDSI